MEPITYIKKVVRRIKRLSSQEEPLFTETVLPHLDLAVSLLTANQEKNGSWANDILVTSYALRALHNVSMTLKNKSMYKREIVIGVNYLEHHVINLTEHILKAKDIYVGLDRTAQAFGNSVCTLWSINPPKKADVKGKTGEAFRKIVKAASEHVIALDNMDSVCSLLNCFSIFQLNSRIESDNFSKLLSFVITKSLSQNVLLPDAFMALCTLTRLQKSGFSSILESAWSNIVTKRTDKWKNENLKSGLNKLVHEKINEVIKENIKDIKSLCYSLILLSEMAIEEEQQRILTQRLMDFLPDVKLWKQFFANRSDSEMQIPLFDLSLITWSLSTSAIATVVMFPAFERKRVLSIMAWYKDLKENRSRIIKNRHYLGMLILIFVLVYAILIVSYFAWPSYGWIFGLAGFAITITSLLAKLFK
jgi:membrane-associated HD superfamily phosphohydrolase